VGKVLVVDDDDGIRDLLVDLLTDEGHRVVAVRDGAEALAVLEHEGQFLIMLDLMMPRMTGQEVIRALETHQALLDCNRVVVMSAADYLRAFSAVLRSHVVTDQVAKPFEVEQLVGLVGTLAPVRDGITGPSQT
jgi:CheY-like chemotaxis protein